MHTERTTPRYVVWQWETPFGPPVWGLLHVLDPRKPGFTLCSCIAEDIPGLGCINQVYGVRARRVAVGLCEDWGCAQAFASEVVQFGKVQPQKSASWPELADKKGAVQESSRPKKAQLQEVATKKGAVRRSSPTKESRASTPPARLL